MNDYLEVMKELEGMRKQWSSSNLKFYRPIFPYGRLTLFMKRSFREANFPRILEPRVLLWCCQTPSHWSLSWAIWIQPPQYHLIILRSIVVLFLIYIFVLHVVSFRHISPPNLYEFLSSMRATFHTHLLLLVVTISTILIFFTPV
jgi:hypothetical protein